MILRSVNIRVTGKYYGDGSQLSFDGTGLVSGSSQVTISSTSGFTTFSSSIATSIAGITDTDNQTLSFNQVNKRLTISDGNTVDLSSLGGGGGGGGSSIWSTRTIILLCIIRFTSNWFIFVDFFNWFDKLFKFN